MEVDSQSLAWILVIIVCYEHLLLSRSGDGILELLTKFTNGNLSLRAKLILLARDDVSGKATISYMLQIKIQKSVRPMQY